MIYYPEPDSSIRDRIKIALDLSNYATKLNYASKLKLLYTLFLHSKKLSE